MVDGEGVESGKVEREWRVERGGRGERGLWVGEGGAIAKSVWIGSNFLQCHGRVCGTALGGIKIETGSGGERAGREWKGWGWGGRLLGWYGECGWCLDGVAVHSAFWCGAVDVMFGQEVRFCSAWEKMRPECDNRKLVRTPATMTML